MRTRGLAALVGVLVAGTFGITSAGALTAPAQAGFSTGSLARTIVLKRCPERTVRVGAHRRVAVSEVMSFRLPKNAAQGPRAWYQLRLRLRLVLSSNTRPGLAAVSVATAGKTCAQFQLRTSGGSRRAVKWSSYDLTTGLRAGRTVGRHLDLAMVNYLQEGGVRPGRSTVTLRVEHLNGYLVRSVLVRAETAIVRTSLSPFPLSLSLDTHPALFRAGEAFTLPVRLATSGGRVVPNVRLDCTVPSGGALKVIRVSPHTFERVQDSANANVTLQTMEPGRYYLTLRAVSSRNRPVLKLAITVGPRPNGVERFWMALSQSRLQLPLVIGGSLLVLAGAWWRQRASWRE
jgi:hypothetical protein